MKIYVLHEMSGYSDDYIDRVHSLYLYEKKCESVKSELEKISEQIEKCDNCVCNGYCIPDCELDDCFNCDETRMRYALKYCDIAKPYLHQEADESHPRIKCKNKIDAHNEGYNYRIEEIEVVE